MNFTLTSIVLLAAVLGGVYAAAGKPVSWARQGPILIAIAATLVRIWLSLDRRLVVEGYAGHDAYLFVWQAAHILEGLWLGEYNYLTLIKGPFLSIWMALMFWLGIPLFLSQSLFYIACVSLMVLALRPMVKSGWALLVLYLVLLFNPMSYTGQIGSIVSRMGIYQSLVLGIAACAIGLFLRWNFPVGRRLVWAGGIGIFLGCFLVTREAGVWIFPMLAVLGGGYLWKCLIQRTESWPTIAGPLLLAAIIPVLAVQAVSYQNWKHYQLWGVTELASGSFVAAYGALSRIIPDENIPYVPVTRASRYKAYAVSPAFAELERHLEGDVGLGWSDPGKHLIGLPVERREIAGGWFMHALREAAMWEEYHVWPTRAREFYQRMANEINAACDSGEIECYHPRSTLAPVWRPEWKTELVRVFGSSLAYLAGFEAYGSISSPSHGQDWVLDMFAEVTRTGVVPWDGDTEIYSSAQDLIKLKQGYLDKIADKYQDWGPPLAILSILVLILSLCLVSRVGTTRFTTLLVPILALLSTTCAYLLMLSLIEISSFETFRTYMLPGNALLLSAVFLCMCLATEIVRGRATIRELDL